MAVFNRAFCCVLDDSIAHLWMPLFGKQYESECGSIGVSLCGILYHLREMKIYHVINNNKYTHSYYIH
jgi:hypothetical protein